MFIERVSAYKVDPQDDGTFTLPDGSAFDVEAYSAIKHGDAIHAHMFGVALGKALIAEVPAAVAHEKANLTIPAYVYAPKPALAIARATLSTLNVHRAEQGIEPARFFRLYTEEMGTTAYGKATLEERQAQSSTWPKQHHMPTTLIENSVVFAVDDSVITGETERKQTARLAAQHVAGVICAYAVEVDPGKAAAFPGIEHEMNVAAKPDLNFVEHLIKSDRFSLNSRVLDLILSSSDQHELAAFFDNCPANTLLEMYEATMNSSLEFVGRYPTAVGLLSRQVADIK